MFERRISRGSSYSAKFLVLHNKHSVRSSSQVQTKCECEFYYLILFFFSIWVFFHEHSRFTGQQGKGKAISLSPLYHFHPLHRHLDISQAITANSSPLHIARSRNRTGNLWFPSASY